MPKTFDEIEAAISDIAYDRRMNKSKDDPFGLLVEELLELIARLRDELDGLRGGR